MDRVFFTLSDLVGAERVFASDQIVQILEISEHTHAAVEGWNGEGSRIVLTEGPDIFVPIKPFEMWKKLRDGQQKCADQALADVGVPADHGSQVDIVWDTNSGPRRMLHWLSDHGFEFEAAAWLNASTLVLLGCTRHTNDGVPAPMPMESWMSFGNFSPAARARLLAKADMGFKKG
jgi:hypothetical protein